MSILQGLLRYHQPCANPFLEQHSASRYFGTIVEALVVRTRDSIHLLWRLLSTWIVTLWNSVLCNTDGLLLGGCPSHLLWVPLLPSALTIPFVGRSCQVGHVHAGGSRKEKGKGASVHRDDSACNLHFVVSANAGDRYTVFFELLSLHRNPHLPTCSYPCLSS